MISHYKTTFLFVFLSTLTLHSLQGTPYRKAIAHIHNKEYRQAHQLLQSINDQEAFSGNCMDFIELLDALKNVPRRSSIPIFKIICSKGPWAIEESLACVLDSHDDTLLADFLKIEPVKDDVRQGFDILYHSSWRRTRSMLSARESSHHPSQKVITYILSASQRALIAEVKRGND